MAAVQLKLLCDLGAMILEVYPGQAPITAAHFLAYANQHLLDGCCFYRAVHPGNDNNPATISVVQGGLNDNPGLGPIAHETTAVTGLRHVDGTISMARDAPGTADCDFFICIGDNPHLDFGGARNPDGQGFAAFGRVVEGMDIVRAIQQLPTCSDAADAYVKGQILSHPVKILSL
eukprot:EG_transcript_36301